MIASSSGWQGCCQYARSEKHTRHFLELYHNLHSFRHGFFVMPFMILVLSWFSGQHLGNFRTGFDSDAAHCVFLFIKQKYCSVYDFNAFNNEKTEKSHEISVSSIIGAAGFEPTA